MRKLIRRLLRPILLRPLPALALLALVGLGGLALVGAKALQRQAGDAPFALEWSQLIPPEEAAARVLQGVVQHGQFDPQALNFELDPVTGQPIGPVRLVRRFDGERVRIEGYLVPLAFEGTKVTMFLLVPYAGACIHVPPPPANQIIYVIPKEGVESDEDPFRPVRVTGTFTAVELSTEFAEVGYQIVADEVVYSG